jgi:hypothetical protein
MGCFAHSSFDREAIEGRAQDDRQKQATAGPSTPLLAMKLREASLRMTVLWSAQYGTAEAVPFRSNSGPSGDVALPATSRRIYT